MKLARCLANAVAILTRSTKVPNSKGFIVFILILCVCTLWFQYPEYDAYSEKTAEEAIQFVAQDARYAEVYRKDTHLPIGVKYVLLWTDPEYAPFYYLGKGQKNLIRYNCSVINCYFTADRRFFGDDLTRFDAVAFNGRNIDLHDLPKKRSPHQKYIYVNTESAQNYPVCNAEYDNYFNWTATYKLSSDVILPYLTIKNETGDVVGPKVDMEWPEFDHKEDKHLEKSLRNKYKVAAWFVSNCKSKSGREKFVAELQTALKIFNETLDVYGQCGQWKCPRYREADCLAILKRGYYFYLSLENSFAEDYVTEKVLTALQNDVVPIVYGGADYSRFLPPGSYINGRELSIPQLARLLYNCKKSPRLYSQFFKWKRKYTYHDHGFRQACSLCTALNNEDMVRRRSSYKDFRKWWNPSDSACRSG